MSTETTKDGRRTPQQKRTDMRNEVIAELIAEGYIITPPADKASKSTAQLIEEQVNSIASATKTLKTLLPVATAASTTTEGKLGEKLEKLLDSI